MHIHISKTKSVWIGRELIKQASATGIDMIDRASHEYLLARGTKC
jgi:hypothetical protein